MKATLLFDLDERDDSYSHKRCLKSLDMIFCIQEFNNQMKAHIKYNEFSDVKQQAYDEVFKLWNETMQEYTIDIDELIY